MVRLAELTDELFIESKEGERCVFIKSDEEGVYCSKGLKKGDPANEIRRRICDSISLQLWGLDKKRCGICIYYKGERLD